MQSTSFLRPVLRSFILVFWRQDDILAIPPDLERIIRDSVAEEFHLQLKQGFAQFLGQHRRKTGPAKLCRRLDAIALTALLVSDLFSLDERILQRCLFDLVLEHILIGKSLWYTAHIIPSLLPWPSCHAGPLPD